MLICLFMNQHMGGFFGFTRSARLLRDVREKAEACPSCALLPASGELRSFVAICIWLAAADREQSSFFHTHHVADKRCWRVVSFS